MLELYHMCQCSKPTSEYLTALCFGAIISFKVVHVLAGQRPCDSLVCGVRRGVGVRMKPRSSGFARAGVLGCPGVRRGHEMLHARPGLLQRKRGTQGERGAGFTRQKASERATKRWVMRHVWHTLATTATAPCCPCQGTCGQWVNACAFAD